MNRDIPRREAAVEEGQSESVVGRVPEARLAEHLAPYEPQLPLDELVRQVNDIYHSLEASSYDSRHPEIEKQLPRIWGEMLEVAEQHLGPDPVRILDWGCGAGFEAWQLVERLPRKRLSLLTCYDPSPEMLAICRSKIERRLPQARFCTQLRELQQDGEKYNLLITNAVLHHVLDPLGAIKSLLPLLTSDAIWLAGHEPSRRFYDNPECMKLLRQFTSKRKRWWKYMLPQNYLRAMAMVMRGSNPFRDLVKATAQECYRKGLFVRRPQPVAVRMLIDVHVASSSGAAGGFDFRDIEEKLRNQWSLLWHKSYSFMGHVYEGMLPRQWRCASEGLASSHPDDGANFSAVWQRSSAGD